MANNGPIAITKFLLDFAAEKLLGTPAPEPAKETVATVVEAVTAKCSPGNLACEWSDGKYNFPPALAELVAQGQEYLPIDKAYSGPVVLAAIVGIGSMYAYHRYNAQDAYAMIKRIIKKEFGDKYLEIYNLFEKAIKDVIDKMIEDFKKQYPNTEQSINQKNNQMRDFKKQVLNALLPTLAQELKIHKEELLEHTKAPKEDEQKSTTSEITMPGAQKSASSAITREKAQKRANKFVLKQFFGIEKENAPKKKTSESLLKKSS